MAAQEMTRLAGGDDEYAAVGIGEIIDTAVPGPMHVLERIGPVAAACAPA